MAAGKRRRGPVKNTQSGQLRLRLPVELHAELAAEAARQGTSLNTLIIALVASGLRWRQPGTVEDAVAGHEGPGS